MEQLRNQQEIPQVSQTVEQENPQAVIGSIMQQVSVMGANDYEMGALALILQKLNDPDPSKRLSPTEAIAQARAIQYGKQDYH